MGSGASSQRGSEAADRYREPSADLSAQLDQFVQRRSPPRAAAAPPPQRRRSRPDGTAAASPPADVAAYLDSVVEARGEGQFDESDRRALRSASPSPPADIAAYLDSVVEARGEGQFDASDRRALRSASPRSADAAAAGAAQMWENMMAFALHHSAAGSTEIVPPDMELEAALEASRASFVAESGRARWELTPAGRAAMTETTPGTAAAELGLRRRPLPPADAEGAPALGPARRSMRARPTQTPAATPQRAASFGGRPRPAAPRRRPPPPAAASAASPPPLRRYDISSDSGSDTDAGAYDDDPDVLPAPLIKLVQRTAGSITVAWDTEGAVVAGREVATGRSLRYELQFTLHDDAPVGNEWKIAVANTDKAEHCVPQVSVPPRCGRRATGTAQPARLTPSLSSSPTPATSSACAASAAGTSGRPPRRCGRGRRRRGRRGRPSRAR